MNDENIAKINEVVTHYFELNPSVDWIPVKVVMPALIEAGVFVKDERKGLPLRKVLRRLDEQSALEKIPSIHAERTTEAVYWYFVKEGEVYAPKEPLPEITKKEQHFLNIQNSDEYYLMDLCDEVLAQQASRKHTFDSLVGNLHKKGKGRTKLPVDAYYEDLKLVVEFYRKTEMLENLDEEEQARVTQIKYYDELKKKAVLKKELRLVEINYGSFESDDDGKLLRTRDKDVLVLTDALKDFLNK